VKKKKAAAPVTVPAAVEGTRAFDWGDWRLAGGLFTLLVLIFYATPLFSPQASIQWDAVDVHYSSQKYFSDELRAGRLPFWTPYIYSGMPFLADQQVGAWYVPNWPFFLAGISARAIEWELALHSLLACLGAWLLARDLLQDARSAIFAGLFYGFGGFFAAHSSHVGMFQAAALFPWLIWLVQRAFLPAGTRRPLLYGALAAAVAGCMILAGHFQTALYCFFGLGLWVAVQRSVRGLAVLAAVAVAAVLLSAIQVLPGLELARNSIRANADFSTGTNGVLRPSALLTLLYPHSNGAATAAYTGPEDVTQVYFYQSLLAVLLCIYGATHRRIRWLALALAVPALWYALGPSGGLYLAIARLPGFRSIRAPVHIWFVISLAMAIVAAAGAEKLSQRWGKGWLPWALMAVAFADLWYWNMEANTLAYARTSYQEGYGAAAILFARGTAPLRSNPLHRLWFETDSNSFGPMNGSLNSRTESSYGYNPQQLQTYADYTAAATGNPKLIDGLSATAKLQSNGQLVSNTTVIPRVSVPRAVVRASSRGALGTLDPAVQSVIDPSAPAFEHDGTARAEVTAYSADRYAIRTMSRGTALVRIAVPFFPGWQASVDGSAAPVIAVDHTWSGVVVPAGSHELIFAYHSNWFATGAAISAAALLVLAAAVGVDLRHGKK
jgi:hypothetical protein